MSTSICRAVGLFGITLLCLCVFMQLLGTPTSMWNVELDEDVLHGPILESLSIPAEHTPLGLCTSHRGRFDFTRAAPDLLVEVSLFRPPCPNS